MYIASCGLAEVLARVVEPLALPPSPAATGAAPGGGAPPDPLAVEEGSGVSSS